MNNNCPHCKRPWSEVEIKIECCNNCGYPDTDSHEDNAESDISEQEEPVFEEESKL